MMRDTIVGDDASELLVCLREGGDDCVYKDGDVFVCAVVCGCHSREIECRDAICDETG